MIKSAIINKDFKEKMDFFDNLFRDKLKNAIDYREISQEKLAHLCNKQSQNAVSKWLTHNDKYKSVPNALELLAISSILGLNIYYFMEPKMSCEEADLTLTPIEKLRKSRSINEFFVETSVINDFFSFLDKTKSISAVAVITTTPHNGSSRALEEYALLHANTVLIVGSRSVSYIEKQLHANFMIEKELTEDHKLFLLFDDAEKIEPALFKEIIINFNTRYRFPIVFTGKYLQTLFVQCALSYLVKDFYFINALLLEDIGKFITTAFPDITENEFNRIVPTLVGGIHEIIGFISKKR